MVSVDTISKIISSKTMGTVAALIFGVLGAVLTSLISGHFADKRATEQEMHDRNMAEISKNNELEVQKTMFDYQNNFNSWSNNKSQMVEAGFNPALMYGGSSSPVTFGATGSASGSASGLPSPLDLTKTFRSIDPFEVVSQKIAQQNADTQLAVGDSMVKKNEADALRASSETARNTYDLNLRKSMEKTIVDQAMANLARTSAETENFKSVARERDALLPYRQENMSAETQRIIQEINREPLVRAQLMAETNRIRSATRLNEEAANTEGYKRSALSAEVANMYESLKGSQVERICREFGLHQRHIPSNRILDNSTWTDSERSCYSALRAVGIPSEEATGIVLWYSGVEPKDLMPSVINGASRILGGSLRGK